MSIVQPYTDGCNVYVKQHWLDPWTLREDLVCLELDRTLGHAIDSARFLFRSGQMLDEPLGDSTFVDVAAADFAGYYVRVERTVSPVLDWVGYIVGEDQLPMGAWDDGAGLQIKGMDQVWSAVGLEWFLDRRQVITSVVYDDPAERRSNRALGFNLGFGNERDAAQQARGNKDTRIAASGAPSFAADTDHAELWNASQVLQHLVAFHGPADVSYIYSPPQFVFDDFTYGSLLEWFYPLLATEGRSVLALLRALVAPQRGLVWWLAYQHDADPAAATMEVRVNSIAASSVSLPGGETLPVASPQVTLNTDTDAQVAGVRIGKDRSTKYDRVRVRGARRVTVMTVSPADGNLVEGWGATLESQYRVAGSLTTSEAADRFRRAEKYANVYTRFLIDSNWDGQCSDGSGAGSFEFACPEMPQGSTSILGTETFTVDGLRLLRTLPLRHGYDYTDATAPVANDTANDPAEWMQPFAIVQHDAKWYPMDRAAAQLDEGTGGSKRLKTNYELRMLDAAPGVELVAFGAMPHALAKNHFDTASPAPSKTRVEVDYDNMRVTVAGEWDAYCEGFHPNTNPTASPLQELVIYIGERARLDYLAAGTVFDVQNATIKTVTTGGPLRDDRELCRQIAQVAYEWYQVERVSFEVSYHTIQEAVSLGDYVATFGAFVPGSGSTLRAAHSTVTQIKHDFARGKTVIRGGFADLDFAAL